MFIHICLLLIIIFALTLFMPMKIREKNYHGTKFNTTNTFSNEKYRREIISTIKFACVWVNYFLDKIVCVWVYSYPSRKHERHFWPNSSRLFEPLVLIFGIAKNFPSDKKNIPWFVSHFRSFITSTSTINIS